DRLRLDRHPAPVAAAHLAPSQAAGRGRLDRALPRGHLGVLSSGRARRWRRAAAQAYFRAHAAEWDRIRKLHVADAAVEAAIRSALAGKPFRSLLDLRTGTGRM